jgi:hypothetical protein
MLYFLLINYLIIFANSQCDFGEPPSPSFPSFPPSFPLFPPSQPSQPQLYPPNQPIYQSIKLNLGSCEIQQPQITSLYLTYQYLDERVKLTINGWDNDALPPDMRAKTKFDIVPLIPKYIYFGHPITNPITNDKTIANYYTGDKWSCDNFNFDFGGGGLNVDRINLFEQTNLTNVSVYMNRYYLENYLLDDNRVLIYGFMSPSSPCTTNDLNKNHCWCPVSQIQLT